MTPDQAQIVKLSFAQVIRDAAKDETAAVA